MNILFLLTQDLTSPAGAGRYYPMAKALVARGHSVRIAALHADFDDLEEKWFERDGVEILYAGQMHVHKVGNEKHYFSGPRLVRVAAKATWSLTRIAIRTPADVVHVGKAHPMNGLAGIAAKALRGRPLVIDCDDLEAVNNRFAGRVQQWGVTLVERLLMLHADHITTHTSVIQDHLMTVGVPAARITYLPHGVDRERFASWDDATVAELRRELNLEGRQVVAFIGSLSLVSHAVDVLISAFSDVRQSFPNAVLLIVGGGEDYSVLQAQARDLALEGSVRFCGRVDPDLVPLYYGLADLSVDPVRDNQAGRSSLSLKMFESWAARVPLITVDVGDRRRVVGDPPAGLVVPPDDPTSMGHAIIQLLEDRAPRAALQKRGRERIAAYYWDELVTGVEDVYAELLSG